MFKRILGATALVLLLSASPAVGTAAPTPPSAGDFGRLPAISHVTLSPDGKQIAAIISPDGASTYISVWKTDAMTEKPRVMSVSKLGGAHFVGVQFVKNDRMAITYQAYVPGSIADGSQHMFEATHTIMVSPDEKGGAQAEVMANSGIVNVAIRDLLPADPKRIVIAARGELYTVNVYTGFAEVLERNSDKWDYSLDAKGQPRVRCEFIGDNTDVAESCEARASLDDAWQPLLTWRAKDREPLSYVGDTDDPNVFLLRTDAGRERAAIVEYDIKAHKQLEVAFEHKLFEAGEPVFSNRTKDYGELIGFSYDADTQRIYWMDGQFEALERNLRDALHINVVKIDWIDPSSGVKAKIDMVDDADVSIVDYSNDLSRVIVEKSGPSQPPEFYLLADGKRLYLLGKAFPAIDPASLG
ncbi:MAG TPA: hypothetical protein VG407_11915, partial [Caulobacteraceae bacterium]|nr:hypothetical protein [Caulobacteraceae bacterium]